MFATGVGSLTIAYDSGVGTYRRSPHLGPRSRRQPYPPPRRAWYPRRVPERLRCLVTFVFWTFVGIGASASALAEPANLAELRERALDLVNEARREKGLQPLKQGSMLNEAAQSHAEDMLRRDYYGHRSPEAETVSDRYREAGGSRWKLVAENIARCSGCPSPPTSERIANLQEGWMNSPPHRENILRRGLEQFGFGIVAKDDANLFAVQTFAGPGTPRGVEPEEQVDAIGRGAQMTIALSVINREREAKGAQRLKSSETLSDWAAAVLPDQDLASFMARETNDPFASLPRHKRSDWRKLSMLIGTCGGCGERPTAADVRFFVNQWRDNPQYRNKLMDPKTTHLGVIVKSNGEGLKVAIAVLGQDR